jgi:hypothetical protein
MSRKKRGGLGESHPQSQGRELQGDYMRGKRTPRNHLNTMEPDKTRGAFSIFKCQVMGVKMKRGRGVLTVLATGVFIARTSG